MNKEIKPGEGVGDIKLGMTREELIAVIGEANEVLEMDFGTDDDEEKIQTWHYDELELSVSFEETADWTITVISMSSEDFTFNGDKLIGLDMETVLNKYKDIGAERVDLEDEELMQEIVVIDDLDLNFWFDGLYENGDTKLMEIQMEVAE